MKIHLVILLLFLTLVACKNDDDYDPVEEIEEKICLNETTIQESNESCESALINQNCEVIHLGSKSLSENIKSDFVDFCNVEGSELTFTNSNGRTIVGTVEHRAFITNASMIVSGYNTPDCISHCIESERASMVISSSRFSLRLEVNPWLKFGIDSTNVSEQLVSGFNIWSILGSTRQIIFQLDVENYFDEPIAPDTTYARYHNNITLNDTNYTELYSNENNNINGLIRKEKVYFHPKNGLIAVRDSLGSLWTKN